MERLQNERGFESNPPPSWVAASLAGARDTISPSCWWAEIGGMGGGIGSVWSAKRELGPRANCTTSDPWACKRMGALARGTPQTQQSEGARRASFGQCGAPACPAAGRARGPPPPLPPARGLGISGALGARPGPAHGERGHFRKAFLSPPAGTLSQMRRGCLLGRWESAGGGQHVDCVAHHAFLLRRT